MKLFKSKASIDANNGYELHDVDTFNTNGSTSYEYEGYLPVINNNQLNWLFPKGSKANAVDIDEGASKRLYQIYQKVRESSLLMKSQFNWSGLPDGLTALCLEEKVLQNGSVALVKVAGKFYAVNYTVDIIDIYGNPGEITVNEPKLLFDKSKPKKFVIFSNDGTGSDLYQFLAPEVNPLIDTKIMLARNPFDSRPQGFFPVSERNNDTVRNSVKRLGRGKSPYNTIVVDNSSDMFKKDGSASNSVVMDKFGSIFIDGTLKNNAPELLQVAQYWENEWKKKLGLSISSSKNSERTIQSQLGSEQSVPQHHLETRLKYREEFCEKMKEIFDVDWTVELNKVDNDIVDNLRDTEISNKKENNNEN